MMLDLHAIMIISFETKKEKNFGLLGIHRGRIGMVGLPGLQVENRHLIFDTSYPIPR
jgi:hypothetical protein